MKIFITGTAGFVGFHLAESLLKEHYEVKGYDAVTDYYDKNLKNKRISILNSYENFTFEKEWLENIEYLESSIKNFKPDCIVHLAAQAGVRYSIDSPKSYVDSNLIGTFNILEVARRINIDHLLIASTSSVYGANEKMPFVETEKTDTQLSFYAATKKANESMAHSYSHLYDIPTTLFRFFTVYGPWGRPDLALFKFAEKILNDEEIEVYNHGNMERDFTYIDDLVQSIKLLLKKPPSQNDFFENDSLSPVAPYRIVNIGNSNQVNLLSFIEEIENCLNKKAIKKMMPMQQGDVPKTKADTTLLEQITGFKPNTSYKKGIKAFIDWYLDYKKNT